MQREFETSKRISRDRVLAAFRFIAPDEDIDLAEAKAPKTILQYASVWRLYTQWCQERGFSAVPASPAQLREYLRHLQGLGHSPSSLDSYLAAVAAVHRYRGYRVDRTLLIEPLKAARRRAGPPRQARALMGMELKKVVGGLKADHPRDARDAVILLLGFACALRSAEIVGLDWQRRGSTLAGGTGTLGFERSGLLVVLATSKASQVTPVELPIADREMPSLTVWVERWVALAQIGAGEPIFRPIDNRGRILARRLAPPAIAEIVRARMLAHAKATGMPETEAILLARAFSAHSLRRGYCSTASEAKLPLGQIRRRSRHGSDELLARYIRTAEGRRQSGLGKIGF